MGPDLPGLVCVRRVDDQRARPHGSDSGLDPMVPTGADPGENIRERQWAGSDPALAPGSTAPVVRTTTARLTYPTMPVNPGDEVYLALRVSNGAEVAVRIYGRRLSTQRDRLRFCREAESWKGLAGLPHVLAVEEVGVTAEGQAFAVTPFCAAGSLADHLLTVGRFTPVEVARIGGKLAQALAAVHGHGLVHRQVSPTNVLIGAAGEPVLTNFGLATTTSFAGDFAPPAPARARPYQAPEAYLPELMSPSADVFALGATLYALLAGWAPRTDEPLPAAIDADNLADLPKVPWALMGIIRQAMAHDPWARYEKVEHLGAALAGLS